MRSPPHRTVRRSPVTASALGAVRHDRASAEAQLGPAHPLVALLAGLQTSAEQTAAVAVVTLIGAGVLLGVHRSPLALLIGAGATAIVPIIRCVALHVTLRTICLDLLANGCRGVRLRVLECECRRLADPRHRARLARSLTRLVKAAQRPSTPLAPEIFSVGVVRSVAPELRAIGERLKTAAPPLQAVALTEQLVCNGASPLYGRDVEPLRRELGRVRFLLENDAPTRSVSLAAR